MALTLGRLIKVSDPVSLIGAGCGALGGNCKASYSCKSLAVIAEIAIGADVGSAPKAAVRPG